MWFVLFYITERKCKRFLWYRLGVGDDAYGCVAAGRTMGVEKCLHRKYVERVEQGLPGKPRVSCEFQNTNESKRFGDLNVHFLVTDCLKTCYWQKKGSYFYGSRPTLLVDGVDDRCDRKSYGWSRRDERKLLLDTTLWRELTTSVMTVTNDCFSTTFSCGIFSCWHLKRFTWC